MESLPSYLKNQYESSCKEVSLLDFSQKNGFQWDTAFYFPEFTDADEMCEVLNIDKLPSKHPRISGIHLIFMKDGKIIYWDRWSGINRKEYEDIGILTNLYFGLGLSGVSPVLFDPSNEIMMFFPDNALFYIDKEDGSFVLKPVNSSVVDHASDDDCFYR